ncbi:LPXTG cell wall anchor domain-containing protein, partial [Candidatus Saccharibacteria bacterium]|nr:LPXTG cell wall anchor domain-containing protein [Candidatus Saccharibacteria bacterium]
QATLINQIFQTSSPDTLGFTTTSPLATPPATTKTDQLDSSGTIEANSFNASVVLFTALGIGLVSLAGYSLYRRKKKS